MKTTGKSEPLFPVAEDAMEEDVASLGAAILKRVDFNSSKIDLNPIFKDVSEKLNNTKTDLLLKQAWDLFDRCVNLIPSTVKNLNISSLNKAYVAHKIRVDHCAPMAWNAVRDPFNKYAGLAIPKDSFAYVVGLHGNITLAQNGTINPVGSKISKQIIEASQKSDQVKADWVVDGINFLEAPVDQFGNYVRTQGEFAADWISTFLCAQGSNDTCSIHQTGIALSQLGGQFINQYPTSSPALAGLGLAVKRSVGYPALGWSAPHLMAGAHKGVIAGYNMIPDGTGTAVVNYVNHGADAAIAHPWIAIESVLAFGLAGWHTYNALLNAGILGVQFNSARAALAAGVAAGTVAAAGVGALTNAAVSSYQSDEGYIGSSVTIIKNGGIGFGGFIRDLAAPTNTTPINGTYDKNWNWHTDQFGKSLGRAIGNNTIGNVVEENPRTTLATAGGTVGLIGRVGYLWHKARAAFVSVAPKLTNSGKNEKPASLLLRTNLYREQWKLGLLTLGGIGYTVGAGVAGAICLPAIGAVGYYYFAG